MLGGVLLMIGLLMSFGKVNEEENAINWLSWDEAMELNKENPRKIFIDVYTDWCGWCKRMDKSTFIDPEVVSYMNVHFYAIKLDAEQKEDIVWNGNTFKYKKGGRRGVHELAYSLLDGKLGYPAFVYLDEEYSRIMISPGFKQAVQIMDELQFAQGEHYKTTDFKTFQKSIK